MENHIILIIGWNHLRYTHENYERFVEWNNKQIKDLENQLFRRRQVVDEWNLLPLPLQIVMDYSFTKYCESTSQRYFDARGGADICYVYYARKLDYKISELDLLHGFALDF